MPAQQIPDHNPDHHEEPETNLLQNEENRRRKGARFEEAAAQYLTANYGYRIVARNFLCKAGEIDLVARDHRTLVFIEVKYRRNEKAGSGPEAVNYPKQIRICRSSDFFRIRYHISPDTPCRYDVVAVTGEEMMLIRNAFSYIPA